MIVGDLIAVLKLFGTMVLVMVLILRMGAKDFVRGDGGVSVICYGD